MAAIPYRSARVDLEYAPMIKDTSARLYVVPLVRPLVVQTTPVALATGLEDPEVPFVYLNPDAKLAAFFRETETVIADACIARKQDWFAIAKNLEDDVLRRGFKTFFDADKGFKVKVPTDVACFDASKAPIGREDIGAGTTVRLVLELARVCFGRHEYGAAWRVAQVQLVDTRCLIVDDPVDDLVADESDDDSDINEFL
jgi:hypothetical protein